MSSDASATYIVAGPTGPVGPQGPQGERGLQGEQGNRGATGSIGPRGNSGTVSVGTVTTLPATGTDQDTLATATVTDVGTSSSAAVLNFGIPGGIRGPKGDPGSFSANISDPTIGTTFSVDGSNGNTFIAGTLDVSKNVSFFSDLDVSGNVDVSGNLTLDGSFTLSNETDSDVNSGAMVITGGLYVGKKIYGGRKLTVATEGIDVLTGDVTMSSGNLDVAGSSTLRGNTSITGTNKFMVGTGATDLSGTLSVEEETILKSGLDVKSGALNIDNSTGLTTIGNNLVANSDVILGASSSNNITFKGDISSNIVPDVDATYNLGAPTLGWNDLHLGSGGVINFGNSNASITHSNNTFTLNSGSTLAAKAISATSINSSGNITVPAGNFISFNADSDTNTAIYRTTNNTNLILRSGGTDYTIPNSFSQDLFLKVGAGGVLSWASPSGGASSSSTNATNFQVTNDTSDTEAYPVFVNEYTGNQGGKVDYGKLKYNAVTGTVTATTFSGNLALSNVTGLGTNVATFLATPNSSHLANAVTDETGSGALVFATSPTLVAPALGTPTGGNLSNCTGYPTSSLSGTITNAQLAGSIANGKLANNTVSFGGVSLALGGSDTTPAFDLSDAINYPTSSLSGTISNLQLAGSIANDKLANNTVSFGGVSLALGGSDATPAFDLSDAINYPTSSLSGTNFSGNATSATTATHIANGAANQIPYQTGSGATSFNSGLTFNGSNTLTVTNFAGNATTATTASQINTSTPSSSSDTGTAGSIVYDSNYLYVCVATDSWKRVALDDSF